MVSRLLRKVLPYLLLPFGLLFLVGGIDIALEDAPSEPKPYSITELLRTPADEMGRWVQVNGGFLYWPAAIEVYTEGTGEEGADETQNVYVPLVDAQLAEALDNESVSDLSPRPIGILVDLDLETLQERFPEYLSDSEEVAMPVDPFEFSFTPRTSFLKLGITGEVLDQFKDIGFEEFVVAAPGSDPYTKKEGGLMALGGALLSVLSVLWIARRRSRR